MNGLIHAIVIKVTLTSMMVMVVLKKLVVTQMPSPILRLTHAFVGLTVLILQVMAYIASQRQNAIV